MSDVSSLWLALSEFFGSDNFAELLQSYYESYISAPFWGIRIFHSILPNRYKITKLHEWGP
jgi:hypothetical protein